MPVSSFKELEVYQKSYKVALETYKITKYFPSEEKYALCSQLQRAAVSVPANIAEGFGRNHVKEFIHFLRISLGSLNEIRVYYDLARDLSYIKPEAFEKMNKEMESISKMLNKLIKSLDKER